jgi:hypothetical protein
MKKTTLLFLSIGLFLYAGQASYAQRGRGAEMASPRIQTRGTAQPRGLENAQTRSQGRANAANENINRGAGQPEMRVAGALERNPQLSSRLEELLPENMSLADAAADFRSQGQFIAALRVSENLGLSFTELKMRMTGEDPMSLGEAIHDMKSDMTESQARTEARRAEAQAKALENQAKAEAKKAEAEAKAAAKGKS